MIPTSLSNRNAKVWKNVDFDIVGVLGIFFPRSSSVKQPMAAFVGAARQSKNLK